MKNKAGVPIDYNFFINCIDRFSCFEGKRYAIRFIGYDKFGIKLVIYKNE